MRQKNVPKELNAPTRIDRCCPAKRSASVQVLGRSLRRHHLHASQREKQRNRTKAMRGDTASISDTINAHLVRSRALYARLVSSPLVPTSACGAAVDGEPAAPTLAYLASSVATTAARIARLETAHLAVENRSIALANLGARRPDMDLRQALAPISSTVQQHEQVLADLLAVVNRMATTLEHQQAAAAATSSASPHNSNSNKPQRRSASNPSGGARRSAVPPLQPLGGVSFLDGDVSPMTRASESQREASGSAAAALSFNEAKRAFLGRAAAATSSPGGSHRGEGDTTLMTTSETVSPARRDGGIGGRAHAARGNSSDDVDDDNDARSGSGSENDDDDDRTDIEAAAARHGGAHAVMGFDDTSTSHSGMRGSGGSPADPYSRAYNALRSTLDFGK